SEIWPAARRQAERQVLEAGLRIGESHAKFLWILHPESSRILSRVPRGLPPAIPGRHRAESFPIPLCKPACPASCERCHDRSVQSEIWRACIRIGFSTPDPPPPIQAAPCNTSLARNLSLRVYIAGWTGTAFRIP